MAQRRSLANSETKKTTMDPTLKKHPSSTNTNTTPPTDLISSFKFNKSKKKPNFPNSNSINKAPPPSSLKTSDLPRIDTNLQAKSLTLSANAGSSLLKKAHHNHNQHQQPIKQSTLDMEKQKTTKEKGKTNLRKSGEEPKRSSVSLVSGGGGGGRRRSFCDSKIELSDFFSSVGARVVAVDMPPFMQIHAVSCARKAYDSQDKLSSKTLAFTLKKEFDGVYGPAWHCIVGTSFGSFVTHSVAGFFYFSMDHKLYILLFKTTVQRAD